MCISHAKFEANNVHGGVSHLRQRAKALVLFATLTGNTESRKEDAKAAALCHESWLRCRDLLKQGQLGEIVGVLASHNITLKKSKGAKA